MMKRHVRRDFDTFLDFSEKQEGRGLCGVRTTERFLGIPSVTAPALVGSWCQPCLKEAMGRVSKFENQDYEHLPIAVRNQWVKFGAEVGRYLYRLP